MSMDRASERRERKATVALAQAEHTAGKEQKEAKRQVMQEMRINRLLQ